MGTPIDPKEIEEIEGGTWTEDKCFYEFEDGSFYDAFGYFFDTTEMDMYGGVYETVEVEEDGEPKFHYYYVPAEDYEYEYVEEREDVENFDL